MAHIRTVIAYTFFTYTYCGEFKIDYENNRFLKDGQPFQYASGSVHYFRVPPEYWQDRLLKLKAASFNTVQTYVAWNIHEPYPNQYNFENEADLVGYISLAQKLNLNVILRPGPFIDAEWDMGGLPWWLLKNRSDPIVLRTSDPKFVSALERWFSILMPLIKPLLYIHGGPILMIQVENEYGSYYACDRNYTATVRDIIRKYLGDDVVLFTTDGDRDYYLKCGIVDDVYPTVDFGPLNDDGVAEAFSVQRNFTPSGGPLVNSEYYPGWFDSWGGKHDGTFPNTTTDTIRSMWRMNASFNMYLFHGGTSFSYWAGAELDGGRFFTVTTSYDYNAPVSEAGDLTPKWEAVRDTMLQLTNDPKYEPVPLPIAKIPYGPIQVTSIGTVLDLLPILAPEGTVIQSRYPLSMEEIDHPFGFILYETILTEKSISINFVDVIRDRAYVMMDGELIGKLDRENSTIDMIDISEISKINSTLQILIENRGRVCYGSQINDSKGLIGNVTVNTTYGEQVLEDWKIYPIDLTRIPYLTFQGDNIRNLKDSRNVSNFIPTIFMGLLNVTRPPYGDTFLNPTGWSKGQAFINEHNLGRYWPIRGPQITLYVPGSYMTEPTSTVILFELDNPGCNEEGRCVVSFTDQHDIGQIDYP